MMIPPSRQVALEIGDAEMSPDPVLPGSAEPITGRYAGGGNRSSLTEDMQKRPTRSGCALCAYYDPERAYCLYVETPVTVLFACPWLLSLQR